MSDASPALVRAAADGNEQAFGILVEERWDYLVRLARSMVGDLEAEDAVQEALLSAWRALPQLEDPEKVTGWLSRIVVRRCLKRLSWWKRRGLFRSHGDHGVDLASQPAEPQRASNPDAGIMVWQLLARLAPRQRVVLHLTVVEGMTDTEIASDLGISEGSVRAHRRRARRAVDAFWRSALVEGRLPERGGDQQVNQALGRGNGRHTIAQATGGKP